MSKIEVPIRLKINTAEGEKSTPAIMKCSPICEPGEKCQRCELRKLRDGEITLGDLT